MIHNVFGCTLNLALSIHQENICVLADFTDAVEAATVSPRALAKQLQLGNTATLERRIRRELEDIGLCRNTHGMFYLFSFLAIDISLT